MSDHITYLLGAGASKEVLPLNKNLLETIEKVLFKPSFSVNELPNKNSFDFFNRIYLPVIEEAKTQISLDTLARINFRNRNKLHDIKTLLWLYFSAHAGARNIDPRYTNLLLKHRNNSSSGFQLRDNLSFISWNYDLQVEEAFSLLNDTNLKDVPKILYTYPAFDFTNPELRLRNSNPDLYKIVHLNGSAGYFYSHFSEKYLPFFNCDFSNITDYSKMLDLVAHEFHTNKSERDSVHMAIKFAEESESEAHIQPAFNIAYKTTHLVIIGYSLPDFNRKIDRLILSQMPSLRYICLQSPDAEYLKNRLLSGFPTIDFNGNKGRKKIEIFTEPNVSEFHYPHDL